jgi:hypothetical protein
MIMNLLKLTVLLAVPNLLFAQDPIAGGAESHFNATEAAANTHADPADPPTAPTAAALAPLTARQKAVRRMRRMVEPDDLIFSAAGAGIDQWRNMPKEWGQGSEGYAERFASAEGYIAAHNAVALGFDVAFHLDPRYRRMPEAGFGARLWNAVSQTFIANKDSGGRMINVSELAGNFGAGFISNTWQPEPYSSTGDALTRGALGLAYHTAKNVAREFWPDLVHPHKHPGSTASGSN